MAKCNLFRTLDTNANGTFYTFSQWSEDLTLQNALGDAYRIVPSRFACFDVNSINNIPERLQNNFEHRCAAFRYFLENDTIETERFTPKHASILFWDTLTKMSISSSNMVYVGEMDLQGTNYIDGTTYSELYCILPTNGRKMKDWQPASSTGTSITYDHACLESGYPFRWTSNSYPSSSQALNHNASMEVTLPGGFSGPAVLTCEDNQTNYSSLNTLDSLHQVYMKDILVNRNYFSIDTEAQQFDFNVIALFYDIVAKDEHNDYHYIYTAVPMGMYILNEKIHKKVTNDDIYGQGTSYGLRVTSKFCAHSIVEQGGDSYQSAQVSASIGDLYPEMAAVMDRFNAAAESLDEYTDKIQNGIETLNTHLSNFKDNKVNVPYIREIKGVGDSKPEKYWFVNGRSTGVKVTGEIHVWEGQSGSGIDINQIIENTVEQTINQHITEITEQIAGSVVNNYIENNPESAVELGKFITLIDKGKYFEDTVITHVPNIEDFQNLEDASGIFKGCSKLKIIPRLELSNVKTLNSAFSGCEKLESIYIPDTHSCEVFTFAFFNCRSLKRLVFDATSAMYFSNCFKGCINLKDLRITNLDPKIIENNPIDLSETKIDFASLEFIVMNMKSQIWENSFDADGPSASITIKCPSGLQDSNKSIIDLIYYAQMNKNIKLNII